MVKHGLQAYVIIAELVQIFTDPLLNCPNVQILLLEGLVKLQLARHLIIVHHFSHTFEMLAKFMLCLHSIFALRLCQVAHNLRQLHFTKLVQLFCIKHSSFNFSYSLREDLDLLIWQISTLYTHGAEQGPTFLVPRVNLQLMFLADGPGF